MNKELIDKIIKNRDFRKSLAMKSHFWFFHIYFSGYITYETAEFQKEIFKLTEEYHGMIAIVAFRGSGKSTIMNMSYPIWSIIGKQESKFVLIIGQTQQQAKQHFKNLKYELENNSILRKDFGPFTTKEEEWNSYSIVLEKYGAKISTASTDQSIRGIRHNQHRPNLIISDDLEDLAFVRSRDNRDKLFDWYTGEVTGTGDKATRQVLIGNMLHEDSLIMKIKDLIESDQLDGVYREYPLLDEKERCIWPGKFKTRADIRKEKRRIGNEFAWQREYLLRIIDNNEKVILPKWIKYYDEIPPINIQNSGFKYFLISIDPAISEKQTADYTAIISAKVFKFDKETMVYILPNPINKRMTFKDMVEITVGKVKSFEGSHRVKTIVEDVGFQKSLIQTLKSEHCNVIEFLPHGSDKRAKLTTAGMLVETGNVLFPKEGCKDLINQLVNFGIEKYDDLADAFSMLVITAMKDKGGANVKIRMGLKKPGDPLYSTINLMNRSF